MISFQSHVVFNKSSYWKSAWPTKQIIHIQLIGTFLMGVISNLYNDQSNARAMISQSAMVYCAGKLTENSCIFRIIMFIS